MSGKQDPIISDLRRGRSNEIPDQEKKITSDSMSGDEDKVRFDARTGR
jgi:transcriptional regulator of met regulon